MAGEMVGVFQRHPLPDGIDLLVWRTPKFKTLTLRLSLHESLDERVSHRALLAGILKRGCRSHPDMKSLSRYLEQLYGASLSLDVSRLGERHHTHLRLRTINSRYLDGAPSALEDGLGLIGEILTEPVTEDRGFPEEAFEQERTNLVRAIQGLIDDKISYAYQRLLEEMFRGEPYARFEWGDEASASKLDRREVLAYHLERCRSAPMECYLVGDVLDEEIEMVKRALGGMIDRAPTEPVVNEVFRESSGTREVVDEYPVSQSKLLIGYRVDTRGLDDADYYALGVYNAILGSGGSLAKLFKEVREERGLAYYAHSSLDRLKGFLVLSAGVNADKATEAAEVMRAQVAAMAAGEFTDEEMEVARSAILNSLTSIHDSPGHAIDFASTSRIVGRPADAEWVAQAVRSVSRDEIVRVADLPVEDTTYLLKGTRDDQPDAD